MAALLYLMLLTPYQDLSRFQIESGVQQIFSPFIQTHDKLESWGYHIRLLLGDISSAGIYVGDELSLSESEYSFIIRSFRHAK